MEGNLTLVELVNCCLDILKQFGKDSRLLQLSFRELCQPRFLVVSIDRLKVSLPQIAFSYKELAKRAVNYLFEMARIPEVFPFSIPPSFIYRKVTMFRVQCC